MCLRGVCTAPWTLAPRNPGLPNTFDIIVCINIQICVAVNRRLRRAKRRAPETRSRRSSPQYSMRKTRQRVGKLYPLRRLLSHGFCIPVDYDFSTNTASSVRASNAAVGALSSEGASGGVVAVVGVVADEEVMLLVVWRCL